MPKRLASRMHADRRGSLCKQLLLLLKVSSDLDLPGVVEIAGFPSASLT